MPNGQDDNNVHYLNEKRTRGRALRRFQALERSLSRRLGAIVAETLDGIDDALFERAEQTRLGGDQELYFTAMRELRMARPQIVEAYGRHLKQRFSAVLSSDGTDAARRPTKEDLTLMDEAAMEESVAVETLVRRIRGQNADVLAEITRELDALVAERTVKESTNPIDPLALAECFTAALVPGAHDLRVRLILLKLFEQKLGARLPRLYAQVAMSLVRARGGKPEPPPTDDASDTEVIPERETHADATVSFALLRHLLGFSPPSGAGGGAGAGAPGPVYPPQVVLQALASLQPQGGDAANTGTPLTPEELRERVLHALAARDSATQGKTLPADAQTAIDVVAMLFDVILDDPRLAPPIKVLIARLQIPVVRAALADSKVFQQRSHPARRLISGIAQAAAGWLPSGDYERDRFYQGVNECVGRVVDAPRADAGDFEAALTAFAELERSETARVQAAEQRTVGKIEAQERLDRARAAVNAAIVDTFAGRELPAPARGLVNEHWSRVLLITHLREGPESALWSGRVDVLRRLLVSLEPASGTEERRERLQLLPPLLRELSEGLQAVGLAEERVRGLIYELEPLHLAALSGAQRAPVTAEVSPEQPQTRSPGGADDTDAAPAGAEPAGLQEARERLAAAPIGTWFERFDGEGFPYRAKLAARLDDGNRLIFVDRSGFRAGDETLDDVAGELLHGHARVLNDSDLFDEALAKVVSRLKARAGEPRDDA